MYFAHLGFMLLVLSISFFSALEMEIEKPLKLQETLELKAYKFKLVNIELIQKQNYLSRIATFEVEQHSRLLTILHPETRFYTVELQQTTESAIYHSLFYDLYLATGELDRNGILMVRVYYKPMVGWIWFSCFLIFIGGVISIIKWLFYITPKKQSAQNN
jgi:cytochrome c-type biogenesis protein CcmF